MLFFGGVEYFLMDELEKGVKTFVVEKDRSRPEGIYGCNQGLQ